MTARRTTRLTRAELRALLALIPAGAGAVLASARRKLLDRLAAVEERMRRRKGRA